MLPASPVPPAPALEIGAEVKDQEIVLTFGARGVIVGRFDFMSRSFDLQDVDFLGGSISSGATSDYSSVSGTFLSADFEAGLELLADVVVNPVFPPEEVERYCAQSAGLLLPARQNPAAQAEDG